MNVEEPTRFFQPGRDLFEDHVRRAQPMIATGVTADWPAAGWDMGTLDRLCGDALVPVEHYTSATSRIGHWITEEMPLREYLAQMAQNRDSYVTTVLINQYLPRLAAELPFPECIPPERLENNQGYYLFLGDRQRTETHFHPALQAVLVNLHGRKKVGLYAPDETRHLYPHPWYGILGPERVPAFNWSRALQGADDQFPDLRKLTGYEFVLKPGEMLFIPIHWWHWTESLGPSISVTLLFNRSKRDRMSWRLALRSYCGNAQYLIRVGAGQLLADRRKRSAGSVEGSALD